MTLSPPHRRRRAIALGLVLGFLMPIARPSRADSLSDALRCREEETKAEAARDQLLEQADSLGARISAGGASINEEWLREAEALQRRAMDRELDLLVVKDRCRRLAERAVRDLDSKITEWESRLSRDAGDEALATSLLLARQSRADLAAGLEAPAILTYADLPPDSSDTQETLEAKLQYYRDVEEYLARIDQRLDRRAKELEAEQRVLEEAGRFLRDLSFLDEGGRVSADGSVRLRSGVPGGGGEGQDRPTMQMPGDARSQTLEFALHASPASPEESDRIRALLQGYRREIARERERIEERTQRIEARLQPDTRAPR